MADLAPSTAAIRARRPLRVRCCFVLVLATAACGAPQIGAGPDASPGDGPGSGSAAGSGSDSRGALAHVVLHSSAEEVLFESPDGSLLARVPVHDGVASADVPVGSMATAGRLADGSYVYETATSLVDGDMLTLAVAPVVPPDLPDIEVALPEPPDHDLAWVTDGGTSDDQDNPRLVKRAGAHGSKSLGFITPQQFSGPHWGYALVVPDAGRGPALDLSTRSWETVDAVAFYALGAATAPSTSSFGVMIDGAYHPLWWGPGFTTRMPVYTGSAAPGAMRLQSSYGWYDAAGAVRWVDDDLLITPTTGAEIDVDIRAPQVPTVEVQFTGPRSFALTGDVAAMRDHSTLVAWIGETRIPWTLHLRGSETAITLPAEGAAPGDVRMVSITSDSAAPAGQIWSHTQDYLREP